MRTIERTFRLKHAFRDPVHDFIRVSNEERRIIDTSCFQRLRRIHQLGTSFFVYHGAEHSRFGHALGTMQVASRIFDAIEAKKPEALGKDEETRDTNWQLVRLAALLHDIGHAPFSHATEVVMPSDDKGRPRRHEQYTASIIRDYPELSQCIDSEFGQLGITASAVAAIIENPAEMGAEGVLLKQIISGELDADRMDYLARDSLFTGATYGRFDMGRLLETITVAHWGEDGTPWLLAVESGGLHALEQLLLARYFMYIQVYLHDGRRFFDFALNRFLRDSLQHGCYPDVTCLDAYLSYDDISVLHDIRTRSDTNQWARAIWERKPWKTVDQTEPHPERAAVRSWSLAQGKLQREFTDDQIFFDDSQGQLYHLTDLGPYSLVKADQEGKYPILVADEQKSVGDLVEKRSGVVRKLSDDIMLMRLYAHPDKLEQVKHSWRQLKWS